MNNKSILGIYKEVGKEPEFRKVKNEKSHIEKLIKGEFSSFDYDDYTIIFKKKNENLLPNIYIDKYSKIGESIKGNVFVVGKDKNNNFISLNKNQFLKVTKFLIKESFSYKNLNKYGRYTPQKNQTNKQNVSLPYSTKINKNSQELILKILFTILNFIKNSADDSSNK